MKLQRFVPLFAAAALVAASALAADHPDMSGTWAIDPALSDFGPMPVPSDLVITVKVEGEDFLVHQTGGGQPDFDLRFNTAGKEVTNELPGATMTSTHHWEGDVMVGAIKIVTQDGTTITFKDQTSYSPDGKVMTFNRNISGPMGDGQMKIVLNKK